MVEKTCSGQREAGKVGRKKVANAVLRKPQPSMLLLAVVRHCITH